MDAVGDHPEVLPADEHVRCLHQRGQRLERLRAPQRVVTMVVVIVVEPAQVVLPCGLQLREAARLGQADPLQSESILSLARLLRRFRPNVRVRERPSTARAESRRANGFPPAHEVRRAVKRTGVKASGLSAS